MAKVIIGNALAITVPLVAMLRAWLFWRHGAYPIAIVYGVVPPLLHVTYLLTALPIDTRAVDCI